MKPIKPRLSLNSMRMQANGRGEILIYDTIGDDWVCEGSLSAGSFVDQLRALGDVAEIDVRINSDGGSVIHGLAMYNALARHPAKITIHIDGLCASMATIVAMAGDRIHMAANALFMIHKPACGMFGDADALRAEADLLDTMCRSVLAIYVARSQGDPDAILAAMSAETWYSAAEAQAAGFVDEITPNKTIATAAAPDARLMQKAPPWAKARLAVMRAQLPQKDAPTMAVTRTDLTVVSEAADSTSGEIQDSTGAVVGTWSLTPAEPPVEAPVEDPEMEGDPEEDEEEEITPAARAKAKAKSPAVARAEGAKAERERITRITALCQQARQPQMVAVLCEDETCTVADARRKLWTALCKANPPVGDDGGDGGKPKPKPDGNDKYRAEYKAQPGYAKSMTEAQYIEMRRIDDGLETLKAGVKATKK